MEQITLTCPACGREINVPAELESFSCVYCGAKHRMAELRAPAAPADEADRAFVEAHLLDCIRDYPDCYKEFTRKKYAAAFEAHREGTRETWEALDRWVCAQPARREALLEEFAELFVQQWEDFHLSQQKARTKHARERLAFANKLTLAWFTVPALRSLGLSVGEDFSCLLRDRFNARYPKNIFNVGTYEEIQGGFRRRGLAGLFKK